ncbi:hypothetical protein JCM11641_004700 [Rhodosporidiobolus odoratus]
MRFNPTLPLRTVEELETAGTKVESESDWTSDSSGSPPASDSTDNSSYDVRHGGHHVHDLGPESGVWYAECRRWKALFELAAPHVRQLEDGSRQVQKNDTEWDDSLGWAPPQPPTLEHLNLTFDFDFDNDAETESFSDMVPDTFPRLGTLVLKILSPEPNPPDSLLVLPSPRKDNSRQSNENLGPASAYSARHSAHSSVPHLDRRRKHRFLVLLFSEPPSKTEEESETTVDVQDDWEAEQYATAI